MGKSRRNAKGAERGREDGAEDLRDAAPVPISFESALERLEGTVARLEEGEMPLEEALELFESGVKLSRQCSTTLEKAERRIEILVADRGMGEDPVAVPFESDEDTGGLREDEDRDDADGEGLEG